MGTTPVASSGCPTNALSSVDLPFELVDAGDVEASFRQLLVERFSVLKISEAPRAQRTGRPGSVDGAEDRNCSEVESAVAVPPRTAPTVGYWVGVISPVAVMRQTPSPSAICLFLRVATSGVNVRDAEGRPRYCPPLPPSAWILRSRVSWFGMTRSQAAAYGSDVDDPSCRTGCLRRRQS